LRQSASRRQSGSVRPVLVFLRSLFRESGADNFQPFEFFKGGKATGYDVELLELTKTKVPFMIREEFIPWTGILPGVSTGKYDAAVSAVLVTKERPGRVGDD
jgi:ABC-type amino acid transport substrate-binding protein